MKKLLIIIGCILLAFVCVLLIMDLRPRGTIPEPPQTVDTLHNDEQTGTDTSPLSLLEDYDYNIEPGETVTVQVVVSDEIVSPEYLAITGNDLENIEIEYTENDLGRLYSLTPKKAGFYTLWIETLNGDCRTDNIFILAGDLEELYPDQLSDRSVCSFAGSGNTVTRTVDVDSVSVLEYSYSGEHHFSIVGYNENGALAGLYANEIGATHGSCVIQPGSYFFEVTASGAWNFEIKKH